MRFQKSSYQPAQRSAAGFTLVELLVVIVIVAILVAILFPVLKSAKERARQATALSNMSEIDRALVQYQTDHDGNSPSVLFGYADSSITPFPSMVGAFGAAEGAGTVAADFPGLYPAYIKDVSVFTDPDNGESDTDTISTTAAVTLPVNSLSIGSHSRNFYTADAFDISPSVTGPNGIAKTPQTVFYQTVWSPLNSGVSQLCVPSPNGSTYITATTYHVPNSNNVLVLFENGSVRLIDGGKFMNSQSTPYTLTSN